MACACIDDLTANARERYGPDAYLETVHILGPGFELRGERPKPLTLRYPKTKVDGTPSARLEKAHIHFAYCPFCGVRYVPESEAV